MGNPHAAHVLGIRASYQIETARQQIQAVAGKGRLVFTSGATEANSLAILGMAFRELRIKGRRRKIVSCTTEHASILNLKRLLSQLGFELRLVPVHNNGRIQLEALERELDRSTLILSIMAVNNETGVTQDWSAIRELAGRTTIHTDAAQALGKVTDLPDRADLVTLSAHKVHGPQGIGALLIRRGSKPDAVFRGGGQQQGLRSGTVPTSLCVGFGASCTQVLSGLPDHLNHIRALSRHLVSGLSIAWPGARRIGEYCVDAIVCMRFPGADARTILGRMPNVAASTGSACDARSDRVSHVLRAMRVRDGRSCLRLGISRLTSAKEIDGFLNQLETIRRHLIG